MSCAVKCPTHGVKASTAYSLPRRCRCEVCRSWRNGYMREYNKRPASKEYDRQYRRAYRLRPERREADLRQHRERMARRRQRPEVQEQRRRYRQRDDVRAKHYEYMRDYNRRDEVKEKKNASFRAMRAEVVAILGGACQEPGCEKRSRLDIHHVNGDGREHRARAGPAGSYREILTGAYPRSAVKVLCRKHHRQADRRRS